MTPEEHVRAGRLIAIIRVPELTRRSAMAITDALVDAGVRALEFTLTSRGAIDAIGAAVETAGHAAAVGAGTVLSEADVKAVSSAGAQFVVSPHVSRQLIHSAHASDMLALPGALTPTEIQTAVDSGARMVKLFPAKPMGGASYLRALRGPFPDVAFVPTGGVETADIADYLAAGATAVALGSSLVTSTEDLDGLRTRAGAAVARARETASPSANQDSRPS